MENVKTRKIKTINIIEMNEPSSIHNTLLSISFKEHRHVTRDSVKSKNVRILSRLLIRLDLHCMLKWHCCR